MLTMKGNEYDATLLISPGLLDLLFGVVNPELFIPDPSFQKVFGPYPGPELSC
jgi:hypothetical protein